ncbi:EAL domain-containing protein [Desulfuromonas sp. KJ2020]|uniref:EAL domain-containing protein n=1 Tax=Desulfuromonas sp. KJ2020 TaxID=2919173 RepID=UPI0020A7C316|nr:EAL domain-containing protein [Desulfuromonas sp. KJ2020]MCP3176953.1 EAL domain-containing protein [Desulfuromonas sp. KJ2020]
MNPSPQTEPVHPMIDQSGTSPHRFSRPLVAAAIASSVIALAHTMGLKVVGEGIEMEEQHQFLKEKGCDMGQGYLFSRPLPAEEVVLAIHPMER